MDSDAESLSGSTGREAEHTSKHALSNAIVQKIAELYDMFVSSASHPSHTINPPLVITQAQPLPLSPTKPLERPVPTPEVFFQIS